MNRKRGESCCPSQVGIKLLPNEIEKRLPVFYKDNFQRIIQDIIQIYIYEANQTYCIVDTEVRQSFFQEYGS